jgi:acylphosphatase
VEEEHSCRRFIVSGRVQGVFYRDSTRKKALSLGLRGWVRNLGSGDVELLAAGPESKLEELQAWLWEGPQMARVTDVSSEVRDINETINSGFDILYTSRGQ